jgi:hypothetical protein
MLPLPPMAVFYCLAMKMRAGFSALQNLVNKPHQSHRRRDQKSDAKTG